MSSFNDRPTASAEDEVIAPNPQLARTFRVLLVDSDANHREKLAGDLEQDHLSIMQAESFDDARQAFDEKRIDVALIDHDLNDGSGIELAREFARSGKSPQTLLLVESPTVELMTTAMRYGISDVVMRPVDIEELRDRVDQAVNRRAVQCDKRRRVKKLRKLCRQLDGARREVTDQVDVLCHDLVTAYQELAMQMQQVVQTSEFTGAIRDELDLESLLRKTLEFVVARAGNTNAALFLPATMDEYTLGGYVNYDCTADSADILLQHLADVIAPRVAERNTPVHITDDATMRKWLGDDSAYLADSHLLGIAATHEDEVLAVLVLFRDSSIPFETELVETMGAVAPLLGEYLARVIRVHHRAIPDTAYDDGEMLF